MSDWYQNNIAEYGSKSNELQKKYNLFSSLRIATFFLFLALSGTSIYFQSWELLTASMVVFIVVFGKLVNRHQQIKTEKVHFDLLMKINQDEMKRLSMDLHSFPDGSAYADPNHPYCTDLDLFGSHSLFQWINRTVTIGGEQLLASNLLQPAEKQVILQRQQATRELAAHPDWGQNFLASGLAFNGVNKKSIDSLLNWVSAETHIPVWFKPALLILPLLAVGLTIGYFSGILSGYLVMGVLVINGFLVYRILPAAQKTYDHTHESIGTLRAYEAMIACIELTDFDSELLIKLRLPFLDQQKSASTTIKQLKDILSRIETRHNFLYWIFNWYFLLDLIWLVQAERWKSKHRDDIARWFQSIMYYEFLVSLGLTAHSQKGLTFPLMTNDIFQFKARNLGHPLIRIDERVSNDFELLNKGTVVVLTGSNMSGKSTFLRTLGINIVLARLGAPVCADELSLGDFSLFTSMRTIDSLEHHVSSFYAELSRINQLINQLNDNKPVLFLLDELLKGTNSRDRNLGSSTLIRQLQQERAFGIVSTHDLALGEMAEGNDSIENFSFNSDLNNGTLNFDYRLTKGLCKSFNATELMAKMGIKFEKDGSRP